MYSGSNNTDDADSAAAAPEGRRSDEEAPAREHADEALDDADEDMAGDGCGGGKWDV